MEVKTSDHPLLDSKPRMSERVKDLKPYDPVSSLDTIKANPGIKHLKLDWNETTIPPSPKVRHALLDYLNNGSKLVLISTGLSTLLENLTNQPLRLPHCSDRGQDQRLHLSSLHLCLDSESLAHFLGHLRPETKVLFRFDGTRRDGRGRRGRLAGTPTSRARARPAPAAGSTSRVPTPDAARRRTRTHRTATRRPGRRATPR